MTKYVDADKLLEWLPRTFGKEDIDYDNYSILIDKINELATEEKTTTVQSKPEDWQVGDRLLMWCVDEGTCDNVDYISSINNENNTLSTVYGFNNSEKKMWYNIDAERRALGAEIAELKEGLAES